MAMPDPDCDTELRPTAGIELDRKPERPDEVEGRSDAERALYRLDRFLASWTPSSPRPTLPARLLTVADAARPITVAQQAAPAEAMTRARSRRPVLKRALRASAVAAAAVAAYTVDSPPGFLKRPASITASQPPEALRQGDETLGGSGRAALPSLMERPGPTPAKPDSGSPPPVNSHSAAPATGSSESASKPAGAAAPGAEIPPSGKARQAAPQQSAPKPPPDQTDPPPFEGALIAAPPPSVATKEAPPAEEAVKAAADPEPKAANEPARGAKGPGPAPPAQQSAHRLGAGEGPKLNAIAFEDAPLPPVRPASHGKPARREKEARAHRNVDVPQAMAERPAPPPEEKIAPPTAGGPDNPLIRLLGDTFK